MTKKQVSSVPVMSLYNHLVIYFFLPIAKKRVAFLYGCLSSTVCLSLFLGIETSAQVLLLLTYYFRSRAAAAATIDFRNLYIFSQKRSWKALKLLPRPLPIVFFMPR